MSLRVTFVLPGLVSIPSGGFKVIYELANGLAKKGHAVHIVHLHAHVPWFQFLRTIRLFPPSIVGPRTRLPHAHVPWFQFLRTIRLEMSRPVAIDFPDADVIVGTGWQTANVIHNLPPEKGRKFFFVQDYEHWVLAEGNRRKDIREAFALPMMRISSSPAVSQMLENMELTFECELCPRLDLDCYDMDCSPESRDSFSVGFPVRIEGFKGTTDGLTTTSILKDHFGERVTIRAFGAIQRPDWVPPWIDYLHYPSDRELRAFYNSIAIFIFPSHVEGWGLPAMESMRCGGAVVSADCIGVRAFIRDGVNGVIVPRKNPTLMAVAVGQLMRDNRRRCNLAHAAYAAMDKFSWAAQINRLQSLLVGPVRGSC